MSVRTRLQITWSPRSNKDKVLILSIILDSSNTLLQKFNFWMTDWWPWSKTGRSTMYILDVFTTIYTSHTLRYMLNLENFPDNYHYIELLKWMCPSFLLLTKFVSYLENFFHDVVEIQKVDTDTEDPVWTIHCTIFRTLSYNLYWIVTYTLSCIQYCIMYYIRYCFLLYP